MTGPLVWIGLLMMVLAFLTLAVACIAQVVEDTNRWRREGPR